MSWFRRILYLSDNPPPFYADVFRIRTEGGMELYLIPLQYPSVTTYTQRNSDHVPKLLLKQFSLYDGSCTVYKELIKEPYKI